MDPGVAGKRDHVAGGGRHGANIGNHGLLRGHFADCLENALAAVGRAAGRRDRYDQRPHPLIVLDRLQPLQKLAVVLNKPGNRYARDLRAAGGGAEVTADGAIERKTQAYQQQNGRKTPKTELAAKLSSISDCRTVHDTLFPFHVPTWTFGLPIRRSIG